MKSAFFALLMTCGSMAFAGLSSQDPNIAKIRADYTAAQATIVADLKPNQEYDCYMFQAWKDAFQIFPTKVSFKRWDGILLMSIDYGPRFSPDVMPVKEAQSQISAKTPNSDSSTSRDDLNFKSTGDLLIIEESTTTSHAGTEEKSIANPKAWTQNFRVCAVPVTPSATSIP
jgi:hypothetical protein